jgi:hypothetical protein
VGRDAGEEFDFACLYNTIILREVGSASGSNYSRLWRMFVLSMFPRYRQFSTKYYTNAPYVI